MINQNKLKIRPQYLSLNKLSQQVNNNLAKLNPVNKSKSKDTVISSNSIKLKGMLSDSFKQTSFSLNKSIKTQASNKTISDRSTSKISNTSIRNQSAIYNQLQNNSMTQKFTRVASALQSKQKDNQLPKRLSLIPSTKEILQTKEISTKPVYYNKMLKGLLGDSYQQRYQKNVTSKKINKTDPDKNSPFSHKIKQNQSVMSIFYSVSSIHKIADNMKQILSEKQTSKIPVQKVESLPKQQVIRKQTVNQFLETQKLKQAETPDVLPKKKTNFCVNHIEKKAKYIDQKKFIYYCSRCALMQTQLGEKIMELPKTIKKYDKQIYEKENLIIPFNEFETKKFQLENFQKFLKDTFKKNESVFDEIRARKFEMKTLYDGQIQQVDQLINLLIEEFNQKRNTIIKQFKHEQYQNQQDLSQKEKSIKDGLNLMRDIDQDIQQNFQNIIQNMDMKPFQSIIQMYEQKVKNSIQLSQQMKNQYINFQKIAIHDKKIYQQNVTQLYNSLFSAKNQQVQLIQVKNNEDARSYCNNQDLNQLINYDQPDQFLEPNILRSKLELSTVNEETNDSSFNNFPNKNEKKNYKNKDIIINDFVGNRQIDQQKNIVNNYQNQVRDRYQQKFQNIDLFGDFNGICHDNDFYSNQKNQMYEYKPLDIQQERKDYTHMQNSQQISSMHIPHNYFEQYNKQDIPNHSDSCECNIEDPILQGNQQLSDQHSFDAQNEYFNKLKSDQNRLSRKNSDNYQLLLDIINQDCNQKSEQNFDQLCDKYI